jgi:futalosine hydrolase
MASKILLITATSAEAAILKKVEGIAYENETFRVSKTEIDLLVTGVGSIATAWSLQNWLSGNERPEFIINAGIAGSYRDDIPVGEVVMPVTECFADSGVEDGEFFNTLFESGLADPDEFPYRSGLIHCDDIISGKLAGVIRAVNAITVNTSTGDINRADKLIKKFNPDIETMEGATFFYICSREEIPFLALRAISNRVETRNKSNWNIRLALENLSEKLKEVIIRLE